MEAIARAEGISSTRVRQLLLLLQLPPEVFEWVDVQELDQTVSFTEKSLRSIASNSGRSRFDSIRSNRSPRITIDTDH